MVSIMSFEICREDPHFPLGGCCFGCSSLSLLGKRVSLPHKHTYVYKCLPPIYIGIPSVHLGFCSLPQLNYSSFVLTKNTRLYSLQVAKLSNSLGEMISYFLPFLTDF